MPLCRGTRIIGSNEARVFRQIINQLRGICLLAGFEEIILPSIYNPSIWTDRTGQEIEQQMWLFPDKSDRPTCLIPEATAIIQELYDNSWSKNRPKPICLFYETRCYRYERPQAGRYREFTQFGVEMLGPNPDQYEGLVKELLFKCLGDRMLPVEFDWEIKRGLSYYTRNGFEARVPSLGAQQQIAGGGVYEQGCGFAIGIDRLVLAIRGEK